MKWFLNMTSVLSRYSDVIAGAALMFIMLLTSFDVILRYLGKPILGSYDMVSLGGAIIIGFAVPKSSLDKTHVSVDVLVEKIPQPRRDIVNLSTRIIAISFFTVLTWNLTKLGISYFRTGESTMTLALPLYPIAFALGVCCFIECLVLLSDAVRIVLGGADHE
jgi:TRAP-type C4-dicarboxylate transport system permease small subunit